MDALSAPTATRPAEAPATPGGPRLRGGRLVLARAAWVGLAGLALVLAVANTLARWTQPSTAPETVRSGLAQLGLSLTFHTAYVVALDVILVLGFWAVGLAIVRRRSDEPMALFTAGMLVTFGSNWVVEEGVLASLHPAWRLPATALDLLAWPVFVAFAYVFPTGQFAPRWTRWFLVILAVLAPLTNLVLAEAKPNWVDRVALLVILVSILVAQAYRYARVSGPVQRQQAKWLVAGLAAMFLTLFGVGIMPVLLFPALGQPGVPAAIHELLIRAAITGAFLLLPLSIGIAILRYRLWEIDSLINRALVYGTLTGALLAIYLGGVVVLQAAFRALVGQASDLAVIVSTLTAAALAQPLRRRLQDVIDRRFYRRKYDAAQALAAFSTRLRDEVDQAVLSDELVGVVAETLQPSSVSLWLRPPGSTPTSQGRPG